MMLDNISTQSGFVATVTTGYVTGTSGYHNATSFQDAIVGYDELPVRGNRHERRKAAAKRRARLKKRGSLTGPRSMRILLDMRPSH